LSHLWAIRLAIINYNSIKHSSLFHSNEYMILLMNILIDLLTKIRLNIFSFALNFPVLIILVLIVPCAHRSVLIVPRAHRSVLIVPCSSFHVLIVPVPPAQYIYILNREWEYSRKTKDQRRREKLWRHSILAPRTKDIWKEFIWEKERKKRKVWDDTCSCLWP
jgi:hypothetical protein